MECFMINIFAISGSLRKLSTNTALLHAATVLAPSNVKIVLYEDLGNLPFFNPDLEGFEPRSVVDFRAKIKAASGVLIASPEYAHGITGVLKNALDWVVGSGEFVNKPVALLNGSGRATIAYESLREIMKTIDAKIIDQASLTIPLPKIIDNTGILASPEICNMLRMAIAEFIFAINPAICLVV